MSGVRVLPRTSSLPDLGALQRQSEQQGPGNLKGLRRSESFSSSGSVSPKVAKDISRDFSEISLTPHNLKPSSTPPTEPLARSSPEIEQQSSAESSGVPHEEPQVIEHGHDEPPKDEPKDLPLQRRDSEPRVLEHSHVESPPDLPMDPPPSLQRRDSEPPNVDVPLRDSQSAIGGLPRHDSQTQLGGVQRQDSHSQLGAPQVPPPQVPPPKTPTEKMQDRALDFVNKRKRGGQEVNPYSEKPILRALKKTDPRNPQGPKIKDNMELREKGRVRNFFKDAFAKESGKEASNLTYGILAPHAFDGVSATKIADDQAIYSGASTDMIKLKEAGSSAGPYDVSLIANVFSLVGDCLKLDTLKVDKEKLANYKRILEPINQRVKDAGVRLQTAQVEHNDALLDAQARGVRPEDDQRCQDAQQELDDAQTEFNAANQQFAESAILKEIKAFYKQDGLGERLGMAGFAIFRSTVGIGGSIVKEGVAIAKTAGDSISSGLSLGTSIASSAASLVSLPVDAYALHRDIRDIREHQNVLKKVKSEQARLQGKDKELEACLKLCNRKQVIGEKRFSAVTNGIKVASGLTAGASLGVGIAMAAGCTTAAALGAAACLTPIGWAIGGVAAACAIGFGIYKLGRFIYNKVQQKRYMEAIDNPDPTTSKAAATLKERLQKKAAKLAGDPKGWKNVQITPEQIKEYATTHLIGRSASLTTSVMLARLREDDLANPGEAITMFKNLGFTDDQIKAMHQAKGRDQQSASEKLLKKTLKLG